MGLCLGVDCDRLVLSKRPWKQVRGRAESIQVNATIRLGAFSLQALPLGLRCVVDLPWNMENQVSLEIPRKM